MKSNVIIREAKKNDAESILHYIDTISGETDYLTFGKGEFSLSVEEEAAFIDSVARQENGIFLVAEMDGRIVGTLNFSGGARPRVAHTGEFGVSVLKAYWGRGIGTALVKYLIDWATQSRCVGKINLRVRSDNAPAIQIYRKLGFVEEGRITREFFVRGRYYDAVFMGLKIDR